MSKVKTFKSMKCKQCNETVEKVDLSAAGVTCWRCVIQLVRGTKCEDGINPFEAPDEDKKV